MLRLLTALALLTAGCGYVGDPMPPLANVPSAVKDLDAAQRAARILIRFTLPTMTTEGTAIRPPLQLDLRIGTAGTGAFSAEDWAARATRVEGGTVTGGVAQFEVPSQPWTGKEVTIAARVIGAHDKESDWSNYVNLAVVPPPEKPLSVNVAAAAAGLHLSWQGPPGEFRIFRRSGDEKAFKPVATVREPEWLDQDFEFGRQYVYRVQRIVSAGGQHAAESELSDEAAITPRDTFPPAAPTGLSASPAPASIELAWERNTEPDLAGYRVYRAAGDGAFERIAEISQIPAYSDARVEPGKVYRYAVTAFDRAGNESNRSSVTESALAGRLAAGRLHGR